MIRRFSSRRHKLDESFLNDRLRNAQAYDRIAGYFSSSILEIAGEAIESIGGPVRVICNSDLDERDVETARAAHQAQRREWCATEPEKHVERGRERFQRLYDLLRSGKMEVKVLPTSKFGLVHGKAGVITLADGTKTSFLGSANETYSAWRMNYELLWEDPSEESVRWVQEEFDALWSHMCAVHLADFVIEDIGRLARRTVIGSIDKWREEAEPASAIIETPVYRREFGLWAHQKHFIKLAYDAHRGPHGARFVLADMVGLGKTIQLALSGMLMALEGDKPVLVLAPKALLQQWQDEMRDLLDMPSALWTGRQWIDENGIEHPSSGLEGILKCPRRVGLVSQGLITHGKGVSDLLLSRDYECVIVDEAHRARRRNLGPGKEGEAPDPNILLNFLYSIAGKTKSLLLATATPVQLYPVEAWDLLNVLNQNNHSVLGRWSNWQQAAEALAVVMGEEKLPEDLKELWRWVRNPLPPAKESPTFALIRDRLSLEPKDIVADGTALDDLPKPYHIRIQDLRPRFGQHHNPFIRHIVRRKRSYLETEIDPTTGEPYLDPIKVELFGEEENEAIQLPSYLEDAYRHAEDFCEVLGNRMKASGFLRTLLLRRVGSTIHAGKRTAENMLAVRSPDPDGEETEESSDSALYPLTEEEKMHLLNFRQRLEANQERDPKYYHVVEYLLEHGWLERGCIIFSQYKDSIRWLAQQLSLEDLPNERIGIYAGGNTSGIMHGGRFTRSSRDDIKMMVQRGQLRLLLGTEAASEGLNLQRLGSLINLDLPWNPTRLEQRKGRIQRIGQRFDTIWIYNMRYRGSVEDRVHELLAERLENIHNLFGQVPDILEDVWIDVARNKIEEAKRTIDKVPDQHPFEIRYHENIEAIDWEQCAEVLDAKERRDQLLKGWEM